MGGYYVRATLPDGAIDRIEGFATERGGRTVDQKSVGDLAALAPK
jgi:hypothetical protein